MIKLSVISGSLAGKVFNIEDVVTIGRNPENTLAFTGLDGRTVSGFHAEIKRQGNFVLLVDKNSTNGTYVNEEKISEHRVSHNDIITFGINGPKLRIVDDQMTQVGASTTFPQVPESSSGPSPLQKTYSDALESTVRPVTPSSQPPPLAPVKKSGSIPLYPDADPSYTMHLSNRIKTGDVLEKEMHDLLKNQARISRMEANSNMSGTDLIAIKAASKAYASKSKKSLKIIIGVSGASLVIILFLFFQNYGVRQKLKQQTLLVEQIKMMNQQLNENPIDPESNDEEKLELLAKVRAQERQLIQMRRQMQTKNLNTLYKNPLGIEIHKVMESFGEKDYVVPDIFIETVDKYLKTWSRNNRFMRVALQNKKLHGKMILDELEKANMPSAFLYLAMHESSLDSVIISSAGARGLWQFMPGTARDFNLFVPDNWRDAASQEDERTHPLKSTQAGIKYLKVLVAELGSIPLAMASYNAGPGRIRSELRKIDDPINNRDFWYIYRSGTLATETNEYVPKIVATILIDLYPHKYGF